MLTRVNYWWKVSRPNHDYSLRWLHYSFPHCLCTKNRWKLQYTWAKQPIPLPCGKNELTITLTLYSAKLFKWPFFRIILLVKVSEKNSCYVLLEKSWSILGHFNSQKQPPTGVTRKRCSENMQQIYRRAPMPKFWNCTSAWVFSCKFAVHFHNTFS